MSTSTSETQESKGFVSETLRRPIQEAVREGVEEALEEERATVRERGGGSSGGGRNWGRLVLLGLIGLGTAFVVMRRRRSDSGGGQGPSTGEIREQSKTTTTPAQPDVGGEESVETMEESLERSEQGEGEGAAEGATPGAGSEDD